LARPVAPKTETALPPQVPLAAPVPKPINRIAALGGERNDPTGTDV
jgi:hypothetical protein